MTSGGGKDNFDTKKFHIWDTFKMVTYKPSHGLLEQC